MRNRQQLELLGILLIVAGVALVLALLAWIAHNPTGRGFGYWIS